MAEFSLNSISMGQALKLIERTYLPRGAGVILEGAPGIGKTSMISTLTRALQAGTADFGGCCFNASGGQSVDMIGYPHSGPMIRATNKIPLMFQPLAREGLRGAYPRLCPDELVHPDTPEHMLPLPIDVQHGTDLRQSDTFTYSQGIAVVDDATKLYSEADMATLSMFLHEGRTGAWGVPTEGWCRILITNAVEHGSNDLAIPAHGRNRAAKFRVHTGVEDILPYWESIGMHPNFRAFAAAEAHTVLGGPIPLKQDQFCTVRSFTEAWMDVMYYLQYDIGIPDLNVDEHGNPLGVYVPSTFPVYGAEEKDPDLRQISDCFTAMIAARCGDAVASKFTDFLVHANERPSYEDIINHPMKTQWPSNAAVQFTVIENLIEQTKFKDLKNIRRYLTRADLSVPKALIGVYCTRMSTKHPLGLMQQDEFLDLMAYAGVAGRANLAA